LFEKERDGEGRRVCEGKGTHGPAMTRGTVVVLLIVVLVL
jgi:hypothetical protein